MIKYKIDEQELRNKYQELQNISDLAKYYNIPRTSMRLILKQLNIATIISKQLNEEFFDKDKETPESFYLAGFIAADGNIDKVKPRIIIALAEKDIDFLTNIKKLIGSNAVIAKRIAYGSKRNSKYKDTISYALRFSSLNIVKDLQRFNIIPNKTKIYDFPSWLIDHPLINHFMRGYNDGDGCLRITKDNQLSFNLVGNQSFLTTYQDILVDNGCLTHHNKIVPDRNVFVLKYCGNRLVPKICQFLYKNSTFHLNRKYDIYKASLT